jgi:hypothetical protein
VRAGAGQVLSGKETIRSPVEPGSDDGELHGEQQGHDRREDNNGRWRISGSDRGDHGEGQDGLGQVQRPEYEPADSESDGDRYARSAEFQRRFEERDRQHHSKPYKGYGASCGCRGRIH